MIRSIALATLATTMLLLPGTAAGNHEAAAGPSVQNQRRFHFIQTIGSYRSEINGIVTAEAPIACNTKINVKLEPPTSGTVNLTANCRISSHKRKAQIATLRAEIAYKMDGAITPAGDCVATAKSDPATGKIDLSCSIEVTAIL